MAVQAQYLAHAFRRDASRAIRQALPDDATTGTSSSVFIGDHQLLAAQQLQSRGATVFSDLTRSRNNNDGCFVPRKRARVAGDDAGAYSLTMEGHGGALLPPLPVLKAFAGDDVRSSREHGSGAASTSGRAAVSQGLLSQLHRHGVEIDALVRIENQRLRAGLEEARRRHVRAVVSALERAATRRLREAEADLSRALVRGAELEEKLRQMVAEEQAWQGVASSHEAAAAGLRASIDQLLQPPCDGGATEVEACVAEDAQSCCFEQDCRVATTATATATACKACGKAGACVLLLPCRHLCLCAGCEAGVDACPVCAATKNASLHVLLS